MAFPDGLTLITVTGQLAGLPDGVQGTVSFRWPDLLGPDGEILAAGMLSVLTDTDGEFTAAVPATNDPLWSPSGWTMRVMITRGSSWLRGAVSLPYDGGAVELADRLNPDDAAAPGQTYALVGHTHAGGGGGVTWDEVSGKPSTFPPTAHSHAIGGVTGLQAALDAKATTVSVAALDDRVDALEAAPGGGTAPTFSRGYLVGTGTDVTVPADAAWAAVSGVTWSIAAVAGDEITVDVRMLIDVAAATDYFDLAVMVSGAPVRCASSGTATPAAEGDPALYPSVNVRFRGSSTGMSFTAQSGDISGGVVTFALIHKGGAGAAKVYRSDAFPLRYCARNDH
jgi:hypothetical protein